SHLTQTANVHGRLNGGPSGIGLERGNHRRPNVVIRPIDVDVVVGRQAVHSDRESVCEFPTRPVVENGSCQRRNGAEVLEASVAGLWWERRRRVREEPTNPAGKRRHGNSCTAWQVHALLGEQRRKTHDTAATGYRHL